VLNKKVPVHRIFQKKWPSIKVFKAVLLNLDNIVASIPDYRTIWWHFWPQQTSKWMKSSYTCGTFRAFQGTHGCSG
jgi:hypothetical protein